MKTPAAVHLAVLLLTVPAARLAAQSEAPVPLDTRVRVTTKSAPDYPMVGALTYWGDRSLELSGHESAARTVPFGDLAKLEAAHGTKSRLERGLAIGTAAGLVAGVGLAIAFTPDNDEYGLGRAGIVIGSTLGGMLIGSVIGALSRTDRWEDVPLSPGASMGPRRLDGS